MSYVESTLRRSSAELERSLHLIEVDTETQDERTSEKSDIAGRIIRGIHKDIQHQFPAIPQYKVETLLTLMSAVDMRGLDPVTSLLFADLSMRLAIILQGHALRRIGSSVREIEDDSDYFKNVLSSWFSTALYMVQSAPLRIGRLAMAAIGGRRDGTLMDRLGRTKAFIFRPNFLISIMFPHVHSADVARRRQDGVMIAATANERPPRLLSGSAILALTQGPFALVRREAQVRREKLEEICAQRASMIGLIARSSLFDALPSSVQDINLGTQKVLGTIQEALRGEKGRSTLTRRSKIEEPSSILKSLQETTRAINSFNDDHVRLKDIYGKPSSTLRYWPVVVGSLVFGQSLYKYAASRSDEIAEVIRNFEATLDGFWKGWIVEPVKGILQTIRHDSDGMTIMGKESLKSDLDSLERMTEEFGREVCRMSPEEAAMVGRKVREGDLTTVLRVYEAELKSPLKSAVLGSLVRTLLIQVQKTKVDVELAMNGIDKLLKSQELTFGFIGVAPSMIIVMLLGTSILRYVNSSPSQGGRKAQRQKSIHSIWRIDHRLKLQGEDEHEDMDQKDTGSYGAFLLELDVLYQHLTMFFKSDKTMRKALEEDIHALGNPDLDDTGRRQGVERLKTFWLPVVIGSL